MNDANHQHFTSTCTSNNDNDDFVSFESCNSRIVTIATSAAVEIPNSTTISEEDVIQRHGQASSSSDAVSASPITRFHSREEGNIDWNVDETTAVVHEEELNQQEQHDQNHGSSMSGAIFNFTNCIVGAGAIGLGGAFAQSGGLVSIVSVTIFAALVKLSTDLVLELSIAVSSSVPQSQYANLSSSIRRFATHTTTALPAEIHSSRPPLQRSLVTYEELGYISFGITGKILVSVSKLLYAFGCLVAYVKVIEDNFGIAIKNIVFGTRRYDEDNGSITFMSLLYAFLTHHNEIVTFIVSTVGILPLCLLRDMTPLANFSILSITATLMIIGIVFYYWINHDTIYPKPTMNLDDHYIIKNEINHIVRNWYHENTTALSSTTFFGEGTSTMQSLYRNWFKIHWIGYLNNVGTFVFSFVCQHTAHITFNSLKPQLQTIQHWKQISFVTLSVSALLSLSIGLLVYMTYWEDTVSDIFQLYPPSVLMDIAKLLLCITMLLTFPLPFFTCREVVIVLLSQFSTIQSCTTQPTRMNLQRSESCDEVVVPNLLLCNSDGLDEPLLQLREARTESNGEDTHNSFFSAMSQNSRSIVNDDFQVECNQVPTLIDHVDIVQTRNEDNSDAERCIPEHPSISSRLHIQSILLPGHVLQLQQPYHALLTITLWFLATSLAITSPSLGDILSLVGCVSGTLIAFVLPGLFAVRIYGQYRFVPTLILIVGGIVGIVGTIFSGRKFAIDSFDSVT